MAVSLVALFLAAGFATPAWAQEAKEDYEFKGPAVAFNFRF